MNAALPRLLSVNAGYMDTAAFLALKGLFTAHVTGNFVTLGAALVTGTSGALAKLLALPVFCVVVIAVRLLSYRLRSRSRPVARTLLATQLTLTILGALLATWLGPFTSAEGYAALATGMTLVAAMAVQNAAHRLHFASAPPSTVMTGTTTQIMMDLADLMHGLTPEKAPATRARLRLCTRCTSLRLLWRVVLLGTAPAGTRRSSDARSPGRGRLPLASNDKKPKNHPVPHGKPTPLRAASLKERFRGWICGTAQDVRRDQ